MRPCEVTAPSTLDTRCNVQAAASSWVDGRCLRLLHHVLNVLLRRLGETPGGLTITVCHPISRVTTQQVSVSVALPHTKACLSGARQGVTPLVPAFRCSACVRTVRLPAGMNPAAPCPLQHARTRLCLAASGGADYRFRSCAE